MYKCWYEYKIMLCFFYWASQVIYLIHTDLCFQEWVFSCSQCRRGFLCVPGNAKYFQEQPTHTYKVAFSRRRQRYILPRLLWSYRLVLLMKNSFYLTVLHNIQSIKDWVNRVGLYLVWDHELAVIFSPVSCVYFTFVENYL